MSKELIGSNREVVGSAAYFEKLHNAHFSGTLRCSRGDDFARSMESLAGNRYCHLFKPNLERIVRELEQDLEQGLRDNDYIRDENADKPVKDAEILRNLTVARVVTPSEAMKAEQAMEDVDDFDFICHVAFDAKPLTRRERANNVKKRDFLNKYKGVAREVLEALLDRYMNTGIYELEKTEVLKLREFKRFGMPAKIASYFGGKAGYFKALKELQDEIYKAG